MYKPIGLSLQGLKLASVLHQSQSFLSHLIEPLLWKV